MAHRSVASENLRMALSFRRRFICALTCTRRQSRPRCALEHKLQVDPRFRLDRTDASIVAIRQITIAPIDTQRHSPLVQWPDTASHAAVSSAQGHSPVCNRKEGEARARPTDSILETREPIATSTCARAAASNAVAWLRVLYTLPHGFTLATTCRRVRRRCCAETALRASSAMQALVA